MKKKRKGNIAILMSVALTVLCGFTAFVVDIGIVYAEKAKLSSALDAAALAAVQELPSDIQRARAVADQYLVLNHVDPSSGIIVFGADNKSIQISTQKRVKHFWAQLIGISDSMIHVKTKAVVAPLRSVTGGIRPFAVEKFPFVYGDQVVLKKGAGSGYHGNYHVVALGGSGSNVFEDNTLYGYAGTISVGDWIDTEPGNMVGATNKIKNYVTMENSTFDNFERDSIRIWVLPLVDTLTVNGRGQVMVTGFGEFFVDGSRNSGGSLELIGRFIRYVVKGDFDTTLQDTGLYSAKLIE